MPRRRNNLKQTTRKPTSAEARQKQLDAQAASKTAPAYHLIAVVTSLHYNTITLTGLSVVFFNFFALFYYDPMYLTENKGAIGPPHWVYYTWAIGLFMYQSLHAINRKQTRRTGIAGPLGEILDHGCDALKITLEVILAARALGLGRSWWTVALQIATLADFYLTTWEQYCTGQLYFGYCSGPADGILIICTIYLLSGYFGPSFWYQRIWTFTPFEHLPLINKLPNLPLNESFIVFGAFRLAFNFIASYMNVRRASGSEVSTARPLHLLLPFLFGTVLRVVWLSHSGYDSSCIIDSAAFVPFLCAWGLQFAHTVGKMFLSHITGEQFSAWDWAWMWGLVGALDSTLPVFGIAPFIQSSSTNTTAFVWITLVVSFVVYARFIMNISNYFGVAWFTMKERDAKRLWHDVRSDMQRY